MSHTLKVGDTLTPDYRQSAKLALPFVKALERSEDCFYAMICNGQYLRAVLGKFELMDTWSDYVKWSVEGAFEFIRKTEFPNSYSRLTSSYFYGSKSEGDALFKLVWGNASEEEQAKVHFFEIALDDENPQKRDMLLFDEAYDAMWDEQDIAAVLDCARRYFSGGHTSNPVWEILSDKTAVAVYDIT